ncbi:hypothetical protein ADL27_38190, partial [Streptomyces sp. NRRL F-6602]
KTPPSYCGQPSGHEPHRDWKSPDAGVCPGYPEPAVGQVWQSADRREPDRYLLITAVDALRATVRPVAWNADSVVPHGARTSRISLDRFRPTSAGYRYIATPKETRP